MPQNNPASGYISAPSSLTDGLPVKTPDGNTVAVQRGSLVHRVDTDPANRKIHVFQPDGQIRTFVKSGEKHNSRADQLALRRRHFSHVTLEQGKK